MYTLFYCDQGQGTFETRIDLIKGLKEILIRDVNIIRNNQKNNECNWDAYEIKINRMLLVISTTDEDLCIFFFNRDMPLNIRRELSDYSFKESFS